MINLFIAVAIGGLIGAVLIQIGLAFRAEQEYYQQRLQDHENTNRYRYRNRRN